MGDWMSQRVRLRMIISPAIAIALLAGVIPTKSARTTACDREPTRMSQRLSMRSDRRPEKNEVRPQINAAGNMISPACWALRSIFDAIDGIDKLTEQFQNLTASLDKLDSTQSKLLKLLPPQIASQETNLELTLSNYATNSGINNQSSLANDNPAALGKEL